MSSAPLAMGLTERIRRHGERLRPYDAPHSTSELATMDVTSRSVRMTMPSSNADGVSRSCTLAGTTARTRM